MTDANAIPRHNLSFRDVRASDSWLGVAGQNRPLADESSLNARASGSPDEPADLPLTHDPEEGLIQDREETRRKPIISINGRDVQEDHPAAA